MCAEQRLSGVDIHLIDNALCFELSELELERSDMEKGVLNISLGTKAAWSYHYSRRVPHRMKTTI